MCEATSESIVKENDPVILYGGYNMVFFLPNVTRGSIFNCRLGNFYHEDIIESRYGSKVIFFLQCQLLSYILK
jgi:tRNA A58 N-methylase Trm61